jgi:histidinol phosphatase-like enzyme (inositol monophosphatase family)
VSELGELLSIARRAADVARDVIMPLYESSLTVELKADRTPVTAADRGAEEAIRAFLERECPGHGILGEEFGEKLGDGRHRWILDPIDGTKSFIHHVPLWGTLVALERDKAPVVGVIACHAAGETAWGATGEGAWLNGARTRVSTVDSLADATVSMTSFSRALRDRPEVLDRLSGHVGLLRAWGDCYGYLMVAAGRADVMLDQEMNIWDMAALVPIISEAGGRITRWDGVVDHDGSAVATNGLLHERVLALLEPE